MTHIIGIDPGLVHTGAVSLHFRPIGLTVESTVFTREQMPQLKSWVHRRSANHVFVEAYRPRGNTYSTDPKMQELMAELRRLLPKAHVIDNTGVKQVVTKELMGVLGVWNFSTPTHHQDLRSAARIAVYGALKDDQLNQELFDYVVRKVTTA